MKTSKFTGKQTTSSVPTFKRDGGAVGNFDGS